MKIKKVNELNETQIKEINELENVCFALENLQNHAFLSNEINFDRKFPCFYLGYEEEKLISFLTTFVPSKMEAEILAVTHPDFREQGRFHTLLEAAHEELRNASIPNILFVVESNSKSGTNVLTHMGMPEIDHSEYRMEYKVLEEKREKCEELTLSFEVVTEKNKHLMNQILKEAFDDIEDSDNFIDSVVHSDHRIGFLALEESKVVGSFSLNEEDGDCFLYGVGVLPTYQGRGFGKQLVYKALMEGAKRSDTLVLDVDSENPVAFSLYQSTGFIITFQVDYFSKKV